MNILITGANRGLGFELAKIFYNNGHIIFPVVRKQQELQKLTYIFLDRCYPILADLNDDKSVEKIQTSLNKYTNCIDLVINNAGIPGKETQLLKTTSEEMMNLFNIHCLGIIRTMKAVLSHLLQSSHPRVINISSRLGSLSKMAAGEFQQDRFSYSYRIAKAAQNMLTLCMQQEFAETGISVTAIHPGQLKTAMAAHDADTPSFQGANNLYLWILNNEQESSGKFIQPCVGEINW